MVKSHSFDPREMYIKRGKDAIQSAANAPEASASTANNPN